MSPQYALVQYLSPIHLILSLRLVARNPTGWKITAILNFIVWQLQLACAEDVRSAKLWNYLNLEQTLKTHLRTHSDEEPFECSYCNTKFRQNVCLKYHVTTHTDERPFECSYCRKGLRKKGTLKFISEYTQMRSPLSALYVKRSLGLLKVWSHIWELIQRKSRSSAPIAKRSFPSALRISSISKDIRIYMNVYCLSKEIYTWEILEGPSQDAHKRKQLECSYCGKTFDSNWSWSHTSKHIPMKDHLSAVNVERSLKQKRT